VLAQAAKQEYTRDEVRRKVGISERQLRSWEKQKLIPSAVSYDFSGLIALRTLKELKRSRISPARMREAVQAIREKLASVSNPLSELRVYAESRKVRVRFSGQEMEPVSGQLLLNFDQRELSRLLALPDRAEAANRRASHDQRMEADRWFQRGLELEQMSAPAAEIIAAYQKAIELDPRSAGALVNLGTVYFHSRAWAEAEAHYRRALEADPEYALAHFNLGNLFDEKGDPARAFFHYQSALRIHPSYADAHYNLALLYQAAGQLLKAVSHWKMYLKLDPGSSWSGIARRELAKLRNATIVRGTKPSPTGAPSSPSGGAPKTAQSGGSSPS
jgi:tetratricopeptide (TPR) repeat protein